MIEERLAELGITLPEPAAPAGHDKIDPAVAPPTPPSALPQELAAKPAADVAEPAQGPR